MPAQASQVTIQEGARRHYEDGEHYARRYESRVEDVEFYLRQARGKRSVLEYGAGTGRLSLPLARAGKEVTAVDPARAMLSVLQRQLALEPLEVRRRVRVVSADMRTYRTRQRYELIVLAFHTFCHLYGHADVSQFLRLAFSHLVPGGVLTFDLPMPHIDMDGYDPIAQVRVTTVDGPVGSQVLTLRLFQPQELLMHLHYAGFVGAKVSADFGTAKVSAETDVLTVTARKP